MQLTSVSFNQSLELVLMLYFYFALFFFAFTAMFLFRAFYRRRSLYLFDNCKGSFQCVVYMWSVTGPYQMLLGLTHRLFLAYPSPQLKILMAIELFFMVYGVLMLYFGYLKSKLTFIAMFGMSFTRFLLQISYWFYENNL